MAYVRPSRNEIFQALFDLTGNLAWTASPGGFLERSRRLRLWDDAPAQPALYQAEHAETYAQVTGMPYKKIYSANWVVYQKSGSDKSVEGTIENNDILDALEAAITPHPPFDRQTLGNRVWHAFLSGEALKVPGDLDDQAMMVVPIKILVP